ncbi:MAG: DUF4406 domain-containing protein [Prevotella sp.]|jgi:hypothetical protein|nr:DUF4406 domain-containing protein [Prevotella sp.]
MSSAESSLIYRLRNKGVRIDTKSKTVYVTEDKTFRTDAKRLIDEFHFSLQTEMPGSTTCGRVYISGPIAHYDLPERILAFRKEEEKLRASGYVPVNPFNNGLPQTSNWRQHMKADMYMLLRCQYIYFMPGWELSKGCKLELDVATSTGIKVLKF